MNYRYAENLIYDAVERVDKEIKFNFDISDIDREMILKIIAKEFKFVFHDALW